MTEKPMPPTNLERFRAARERCRATHGWPNTLEQDIEFRHQWRMQCIEQQLERIADTLDKLADAAIRVEIHEEHVVEGSEHIRITTD